MTWVSSVVFLWSDHTCSHPKWPLTTCIFITNYILSVNQLDWGIPWQLDNRNYFIHTKINYLCYHIIFILTNVWKLQDRPLGQVLLPIIFIAASTRTDFYLDNRNYIDGHFIIGETYYYYYCRPYAIHDKINYISHILTIFYTY